MAVSTTISALALCFALAQANDAAQPLSTFHDDLSRVTISYPATLKAKSKEEREAAVNQAYAKVNSQQAAAATAIASSNIPFIATTRPGTPFAMVQFSRFEEKSVNKPDVQAALRDLATSIMRSSMGAMPAPHVGELVSVGMAAHSGIGVFGSARLPSVNRTLYGATVCFNNSGQDACLLEMAFEKSTLIELLHSQVQFDGEAGRPLVERPIDF